MPSTSIKSLLWLVGSDVAIAATVFEAEATGTLYMLRGCLRMGTTNGASTRELERLSVFNSDTKIKIRGVGCQPTEPWQSFMLAVSSIMSMI